MICFWGLYLCLLLGSFCSGVNAHEVYIISGVVTNNNEPLPNVSVYIQQTGQGFSTNIEGRFTIRLKSGKYDIEFSHLGFQQKTHSITLDQSNIDLQIELEPRPLYIDGGLVGSTKEDPAYPMIRKAIAKARFHQLQCSSYIAEVYTKGNLIIHKAPRLFRSELAESGITPGVPFPVESINQVTYTMPNQYIEKVTHIKTKAKNPELSSPNIYVNASFYNPTLGQSVSPLSPDALIYYRFSYQGGFEERGHWVNKIRVEPKKKGLGVFSGDLYLIDELWSIHSLDLKTRVSGVNARVKQIYKPQDHNIWLPVQHLITFDGKVMGFEFDYQYHAWVEYKEVQSNPDLKNTPRLVDRRQGDMDKKNRISNAEEALNTLQSKEKITRKDLKKAIKKYEKENTNKTIESDYSFSIDSSAHDQDSQFWEQRRPVPLTQEERAGYRFEDSSALTKEDPKLGSNKKKWGIRTLFLPQSRNIAQGWSIHTDKLLDIHYNTVEGYRFLNHSFVQLKPQDSMPYYYRLGLISRYGFGSQRATFLGYLQYNGKKEFQQYGVALWAGSHIRQFDPNNPISENLNLLYTLGGMNYMRLLHEHIYKLEAHYDAQKKFEWHFEVMHAERNMLTNIENPGLWSTISALENTPEYTHPDLLENIMNHSVLLQRTVLKWRPGVRYSRINGRIINNKKRSAEWIARYSSGTYLTPTQLATQSPWHQIEAEFKQQFKIRTLNRLGLRFRAGNYFNGSPIGPDATHFGGNQTVFLASNQSFSALDYYRFSSTGSYFTAHIHYQFRKLFFTQIPSINLLGIREFLFINTLWQEHPELPHYTEVGYAIEAPGRLIRLEALWSNAPFQPSQWHPRIGIRGLFEF